MEKQGVRENPIRRGGYSGGAAPTQPVRFELASERAEEIQANRTNPRRKGATPTMGVSQVRGGRSYTISGALKDALHKKGGNLDWGSIAKNSFVKAFSGGRAVPSSGLSQFRGGAMERMVGAGHGSDSSSDEECEGMGKYEGMGKLVIIHGGDRGAEVLAREKASRPAIRSGLSAQHSAEAKQMGQHLGKHLLSVKGGGFFELFAKGVVEAGQKGESVAEQTGMPNANIPPPPSGIMTTTTPPTEEEMVGEPTSGSGSDKPPEQIKLDKMLKKEGAGILDDIRNPQYAVTKPAMKPAVIGEYYHDNRAKPAVMGPYYHDYRATPAVLKPAVMGPYHDYRAETMEIKNPFMKKKLNGGKSLLGYFGDYVGKHVSNPKSMFHAVAKGVVNNAVPLVDILTKDLKGTGYLSGQYEGMGVDYNEQRRQGLAKRNAANAAAASRRTPAQNEAIAKQQAELRATMKNQKGSTEEEKRASYSRRSVGRGVGCGARATRAAIVKKVMAEKGCSMIEASKYVKEHGLYKGGAAMTGGQERTPEEEQYYAINGHYPIKERASFDPRAQKKYTKQPYTYMPPEFDEDYNEATDMSPHKIKERFAEKRENDEKKRVERLAAMSGLRGPHQVVAKDPILGPKGAGKQRRAPAGPSDGRRKRAEIVKKVMAEKGCSMIEASKHVKAHGLY